ncbi:hypothetical protein [Nocardia otitidiscaviarum]|uniref:hypothetical protein n=1 Tax=Nocardia otitidiscaviarum TaxID=1823 RepID=UPI0004A72D8C|nr:hypothetical protein [Nocardia otitidiscaviarum]
MRHDIPDYDNPAVKGLLLSSQMRALMFERGEIAQALYREVVAKRTGRLARSARVETFKGGLVRPGDRWCARLIVEAPYAASHEYGVDDGDMRIVAGVYDLNQVLNMLGSA